MLLCVSEQWLPSNRALNLSFYCSLLYVFVWSLALTQVREKHHGLSVKQTLQSYKPRAPMKPPTCN